MIGPSFSCDAVNGARIAVRAAGIIVANDDTIPPVERVEILNALGMAADYLESAREAMPSESRIITPP